MKLAITIAQIIIGVVVSGLILIQAKGVGLGRSMGSGSYHSKRGVESLVFKTTIFLAVVFVVLSLVTHLV